MRRLLALSALCLAGTLAHATPIDLYYTGTIDSLKITIGGVTVDAIGLLADKNVGGALRTDSALYGTGGPPWPAFIGAVDKVFSIPAPIDVVDFTVGWAPGIVEPSDYSVAGCNGSYLCEPFDFINMHRTAGDDTVSIGENMTLTSGNTSAYSYVFMDFAGPSLFPSAPGSIMSLDDLIGMTNWTNGSAKFGQSLIQWNNGTPTSIGYQATFNVTGFGTAASVPEPASLALFGAGLLGMFLVWRRRPNNSC